jgi:hypothetical protein
MKKLDPGSKIPNLGSERMHYIFISAVWYYEFSEYTIFKTEYKSRLNIYL